MLSTSVTVLSPSPVKSPASGGVGAVAVRRRAEGGRLLRIDRLVELLDQRGDLRVGDLGGVLAAVGRGEGDVVGHPDLDVRPTARSV